MKLYAKTSKPVALNSVEFRLEGRVRSKKNSKQLIVRRGKTRLVSSEAFTEWEASARAQLFLEKRRLENGGFLFPLEGNLGLRITFSMKGRANEPDLSNLIEGPQDLLQELGIIKNDKHIVQIEAIKEMDAIFDGCEMVVYKVGV